MDSGFVLNAWINVLTLIALLWGIIGVFRKLGSREAQFDTLVKTSEKMADLVQLHDKEIAVLKQRLDTLDDKVCNQ